MTPFLIVLIISGSSIAEGQGSIAPSEAYNLISLHAERRASAPLIPSAFDGGALPDTVRAGHVFITNLPDSLGSQAVVHYRGIALPALSYLSGRAFFWRTDPGDRGDHEFWFRAVLQDERVDSLSIRVTVE